jgi:hypothetical protein
MVYNIDSVVINGAYMKTCKKCGEEKSLKEFYKKHGYLIHSCKSCCISYEKNRRLKKIDEIRLYDKLRANLPHRIEARKKYFQTENGKLSRKKARKKYIYVHPLRRAAHLIIGNAVARKKIIKPDNCSICNSTIKIEAHHDDYTKPLLIRWLCEKCHKEWHKNNTTIYEV